MFFKGKKNLCENNPVTNYREELLKSLRFLLKVILRDFVFFSLDVLNCLSLSRAMNLICKHVWMFLNGKQNLQGLC